MSSKDHNKWRVTFCLSILLIMFSALISHAMAERSTKTSRRIDTQVNTPSGAEQPDAGVDSGDADVTDNSDVSHVHISKQLQLALAKICVSESGFQVRSNDCTLIYHVLRRRSSTGEVTMGIMKAYARKTFDENRQDPRRWILHLNHTFEEPMGWAEHVTVPWSTRRDGFAEVYSHAGMLLRTRPETTPCGAKVSHWGARGFRRELHLSQGWKLVRCGNTHNDFWYVPTRRDIEEQQRASQEMASL